MVSSWPVRPLRAVAALALAGSVGTVLTAGVGVPTATAHSRTQFSAVASKARKCFGARVSARSVDGFAVRATVTGVVRARLQPVNAAAVADDWDVAVFDAATGRLVAASAAPRSYEVADGQVTAGEQLWVQGCRYGGDASTVRVSVTFAAAQVLEDPESAADPAQLVTVRTPTLAAQRTLAALGVDRTETATATRSEVVLHGRADADRIRRAGLHYQVEIADLGADAERARRADARYAAATTRSALPSGRTSYRHLYDYDYEMKELARRHPKLVRSITLSERSAEGRDISGLEITDHVRNTADGKPVFLDLGLVHAREWPSGELPMEWAYDLVGRYGRRPAVIRLLERARSIIVPVVNPDGFSVSREAVPRGDFSPADYEDQRKDCDVAGAPAGRGLDSGICPASPAGTNRGTDLNRNFGAFWGGAGAGTSWSDETYRGTAPFSAPESRAVRDLISSRQVTNMVVNHTAAGLVLRPPGLLAEGTPVDEPLLAQLGQRFADRNGYPSVPVYGLTDATGGSDEWAYWIGGTLAFTFEIGTPGFHPAFSNVVAQYLGRAPAAGAGKGGNRAAYLAMLAATAKTSDHAQITGHAPAGWTLRLRKTFQTPTSPVLSDDGSAGAALLVTDTFHSRLRAPGGRFHWAVNPSTRPYVAGRYGRTPTAPPQASRALVNPPGEPPPGDDQGTNGPHEEAYFTVQRPPQADNGSVTVRIAWDNPDAFWYMDVEKADGTFVSETYGGDATSQTITVTDPDPGNYKVNIVNGGQPDGGPFVDWTGQVSYASPTPPVAGVTEPWTLTCQRPNGSLAAVRQFLVRRGQTADVGRVCGR